MQKQHKTFKKCMLYSYSTLLQFQCACCEETHREDYMQTIMNAIRSIANSDFINSENRWFDNAEPQDSAMISFFKTEFKNQWKAAYQYYKSTGSVPKGNNW